MKKSSLSGRKIDPRANGNRPPHTNICQSLRRAYICSKKSSSGYINQSALSLKYFRHDLLLCACTCARERVEKSKRRDGSKCPQSKLFAVYSMVCVCVFLDSMTKESCCTHTEREMVCRQFRGQGSS